MEKLGEREIRQARYWNTDGRGISIVAVITQGIDWVAYIGTDEGWSDDECKEWAAKYGAKLSKADAEYYFPEIKLPYRL